MVRRMYTSGVLFIVLLVYVHGQGEVENELLDRQEEESVEITPKDVVTPIVLWHGMGDTCCAPWSIGSIQKLLEQHIPGVHVNSLRIGNNFEEQFANSYFMDSNQQVELACKLVTNDPALQNGYHAVGFSQGGQFLRALAQRCPSPPMLNLITFGAQHQGVYGLPRCPGENGTLCNFVRELLNYGAYTSFVQQRVVQAQYWHDPLNEELYRQKSLFLADINNEREPRNSDYAVNLNKLKNLVLVKFEGDTMVDPKETEVFGWYVPGQANVIQDMRETALYTEDWIGLRQLDNAGKVKIYGVPGNHLQIDDGWLTNEIIPKYLTSSA